MDELNATQIALEIVKLRCDVPGVTVMDMAKQVIEIRDMLMGVTAPA